MEYQDDQKRKTAHVITSTVWTTPGDGGATEAIQMQKQFADAKAAISLIIASNKLLPVGNTGETFLSHPFASPQH